MNYKKASEKIFNQIAKSKSILLHLHPGPDGDSVGSALAMYHFLRSQNKQVTLISGDSTTPQSFLVLSGSDNITKANYFNIDLKQFDLFIILDTSSLNQISKIDKVVFPKSLKTICIDHHQSNQHFADINLVDLSSPATAQIVARLFLQNKVKITPDMATCLLLGIHTDTGGYKYFPTSSITFSIASKLTKIAPDFYQTIFNFENQDKPGRLLMMSLLLNNINTYFGGKVALSTVSQSQIKNKKIEPEALFTVDIANTIKSVVGYEIGGTLIEGNDGKVKVSLRTRDSSIYDLSKIATLTGYGGGHKAAAGASIPFRLSKSLKILLEAIAKNNPELGSP
ncbi:MAG: DHH family phosphoesterase [Candidatus Shapirobacteria bacterium]